MSATEEFPTGPGEQTDCQSSRWREGTEAFACSEMGAAFWMGRDLREPRLGSKQPVERKPGGQRAAAGGTLEGQQQPAEASAPASAFGGALLWDVNTWAGACGP